MLLLLLSHQNPTHVAADVHVLDDATYIILEDSVTAIALDDAPATALDLADAFATVVDVECGRATQIELLNDDATEITLTLEPPP